MLNVSPAALPPQAYILKVIAVVIFWIAGKIYCCSTRPQECLYWLYSRSKTGTESANRTRSRCLACIDKGNLKLIAILLLG